MPLQNRFKSFIKILKISSFISCSALFVAHHIRQTCKSIGRIVNADVLEVEKKSNPEYIYIEDPSYSITLRMEHDKENRQSIGFNRIWKSLKHSLAWRLLWLCRHGNHEQRNVALEQLAAFKNNKVWDCLKLAQALDQHTAVLLARTRGADLRYFLPPPIHVRRAAHSPELLSYKLHDLLAATQNVRPHSCIKQFLFKHFANVQEQAMESDHIPAKPDSLSERDLCMLCLDAIYHHLSLFNSKNYEDDESAAQLIKLGLLPCLAEFILRNGDDAEVDLAVLRILTVFSVYTNLLEDFFQNGLIRELSRLVRSSDVRMSSSAAVCLANLSGEHCYRPGLYLLHPIYRTRSTQTCDTLLVHGLRGGVFVTWRQRDRKCAEPLGILEGTVSDIDCDIPLKENADEPKYIDPELQQVLNDLIELEEEALLSGFDVVLRDLPTQAKREPANGTPLTVTRKRSSLIQEEHDRATYTLCWPKDWLPEDCSNLRILGVNYWSSLSEWLERCPLQGTDIAARAAELAPDLIDARVGITNVPVVWLAHSMGGLIVKQVLNQAGQSTDRAFNKLCESTKAVFFYSTPHKGSALATMPRAAAAVLWPSADVMQLQENSPILLEIHTAFLENADRYSWETISFAESQPTLVTAFKVPVHFVKAMSADLGRGPFYELPLDHLCICKPATRQSILYTTVLDVINRVTDKDVELKYYNPFLQWILNIFWWSLQKRAKEVIDTIDESQSSDGLRWFEQFLLETFTDGFTD